MSAFNQQPRHRLAARGNLVALPARMPGEPLWHQPAAARQRQPIVPLVILSIIALMVAAPAAMSGQGVSSNPITLMHDIADSTYTITGLLDQSNTLLGKIDGNIKPLNELNGTMAKIAVSSAGMATKTKTLDSSLGEVGTSVSGSRSKLTTVDGKLTGTATSMGELRTSVNGSLRSTRRIVREFRTIDRNIGTMDAGLGQTITLMEQSTPATRSFAENRTKVPIAGGDGRRYQAPNVLPGNRVMSVILPMINSMQQGGTIVARKDSAQASNPLVGTLLERQVPNGTNVFVTIRPFDGSYGLPGRTYFVEHRARGF